MTENPYEPSSAPLGKHDAPSEYQLRLFHPVQVIVASLFGHALAAGFMIGLNDFSLGNTRRAIGIIVGCVVYTCLILFLGNSIPQGVILALVLLMTPVSALWSWLPIRHLLHGSIQFRSNALVFVIACLGFVANIVLLILISNVEPPL